MQELLELTDAEIMARVTARKPAAKLIKSVQHLQRSWLQVMTQTPMAKQDVYHHIGLHCSICNLIVASNLASDLIHHLYSGHTIRTAATVIL